MVLVSFGYELYIASVMFIKNVVHDLCFRGHNGVHLWNVYLKLKRKKNNELVDALIVHVVRLVGLTLSPVYCLKYYGQMVIELNNMLVAEK